MGAWGWIRGWVPLFVVGLTAGGVRADLIVTLVPVDAAGVEVPATVPEGETLRVSIRLSVDGADNPLPDVRTLQFDFSSTDTGLEPGSFTWLVDPSAYSLLSNTLPTPSAASFAPNGTFGLLTLTDQPAEVARVDVLVRGSGTLNVVGGLGIGEGTVASFSGGNGPIPTTFSLLAGNLQGGTLSIEVGTPSPPTPPPPDEGGGGDQGGTTPPDESTPSDGSGTPGDSQPPGDGGDNGNGSPSEGQGPGGGGAPLCGAGMPQPGAAILILLGGLRFAGVGRRRRSHG